MQTKRFSISLFICLCILGHTYSYGQTWSWAKAEVNSAGTSAVDPWAMCGDKYGNVFETGFFNGQCTWSAYTLYCNTSGGDAFFVKYDSTGNVKWAQSPTLTNRNLSNAQGYGVAADRYGNSYFTGYIEGPGYFGSRYINTNYSDVFLVKYDVNGNMLWVDTATFNSSACAAVAKAVCTDSSNNVYLGGGFSDTISFGHYTLKSIARGGNMFLAKFSSAGSVLWAKSPICKSSYASQPYAVCSDNAKNVYMIGTFADTVIFGSYTLIETAYTGNVFIAKYDSNGNFKWAKQAYATTTFSSSVPYSAVVDKACNIFITGVFTDTVCFGRDTLYNGGKPGNVFIARYDSSGKEVWAESSKGKPRYGIIGYSISQDKWGQLYVSGQQGGDTVSIDSVVLTGAGGDNSFIIKLDTAGKALCGISTNNYNDDYNGVVADPNSHEVYFGGDVAWGPWYVGPDTLSGNNEFAFLAKADWPCGQPPPVLTGTNELSNQKPSVTVFPNPSNGVFNLQIGNYELGINSNVDVYNVLGEKVYTLTQPSPIGDGVSAAFQINLSAQPNGVYFYRLTSDRGALIGQGKLVVAR